MVIKAKFGSDTSFLFDLKMLYTVTLNNQLFLLMLIEQCGLAGINIISANTDSITVRTDVNKVPTLEFIVAEWEKVSLHTMEYTPYTRIIYRDVNNYLSETTDGKVKCKGCFEKDRDWNKNHSMMIIPIALEEYYLKGILPDDTVKSHTNIFDFLKAVKGNRSTKYVSRELTTTGVDNTKLQQRVNRYYISNKGTKLIKIMPPLENEDGTLKADKLAKYKANNPQQLNLFDFIDDVIIKKNREFEVESGFKTNVVNRLQSTDMNKFDINYDYYINECYKIINEIN